MPTVNLSQIGQIAVNAHDIDRAVEFYRETLGMKHLFTTYDLWMAFFRDPENNLLALMSKSPRT